MSPQDPDLKFSATLILEHFGPMLPHLNNAACNHCDPSPEGAEARFIAITKSESPLKQDRPETRGAVARRVGHCAMQLPRWKGVPRHRPDASGIGLMKNPLRQ
jgi:hypothetical protein